MKTRDQGWGSRQKPTTAKAMRRVASGKLQPLRPLTKAQNAERKARVASAMRRKP